MGKRNPSARRKDSNINRKKEYSDKELVDYSVFDHITSKKQIRDVNKKSSKLFSYFIIGILIFGTLLATGILSPEISQSNNGLNSSEDNSDTKISVVLYSSPTCSCCHEYVNYLDDNGFSTFQKRTEDYELIKDQNGIPVDLRSCHTTIIGDYFAEGHIPVSVIKDMINIEPDFDGIALPGMPSGSPGMSGPKNTAWDISSIKNGISTGIFQTL